MKIMLEILKMAERHKYLQVEEYTGSRGLEDIVTGVLLGTLLQHCTTHLKRNIISNVRNGNKCEVANDLRQVFQTGHEYAWSDTE